MANCEKKNVFECSFFYFESAGVIFCLFVVLFIYLRFRSEVKHLRLVMEHWIWQTDTSCYEYN